jgi:hypothetical protein
MTPTLDVVEMNLRKGGRQRHLRLGVVHDQPALPSTLVASAARILGQPL